MPVQIVQLPFTAEINKMLRPHFARIFLVPTGRDQFGHDDVELLRRLFVASEKGVSVAVSLLDVAGGVTLSDVLVSVSAALDEIYVS